MAEREFTIRCGRRCIHLTLSQKLIYNIMGSWLSSEMMITIVTFFFVSLLASQSYLVDLLQDGKSAISLYLHQVVISICFIILLIISYLEILEWICYLSLLPDQEG